MSDNGDSEDLSASKSRIIRDRVILGLTVALFVWPIVRGFFVRGPKNAYSFLAGDCFYYFAVARNAALTGRFTFDLEHPTNGFHPLWQLWVVVLYKVCAWLSVPDAIFPVVVLLTTVAFITLAIYVLSKCFVAAHGSVPVLFVLLPLGVYGLAKAPIQPTLGPLWSYADGMESSFVILSYALLLWIVVRPGFLESVSSALLTGLVAALLCLSRLDHALFMIPLFTCLAIECLVRRDKKRLMLAVLAGVPVLVAMMTYFAINLYYAGSAMPTSAIVKSTFPDARFVPLWKDVFDALRAPAAADRSSFWHASQILIPMVFAAAALLRSTVILIRRRWTSFEFALCVSALFVLLLGAYDWLYVPLWHQGHWYFPLSVLFVSLWTLHVLNNCTRFRRLQSRFMWPMLAVSVALLDAFSLFYWRTNPNESYHDFLTEEVPALREYYEGQTIKLIEFDDGILSYSTGFHAMSGYLLAADKESVDYVIKEHKSLLTLAYDRGFDRIATWGYGTPQGLQYGCSSAEIECLMGPMGYLMRDMARLPEPSPFSYSVEYVSPSGQFKVLRMRPVDESYLEADQLRLAGDWQGVVRALERAAHSDTIPKERFNNQLGEAYLHVDDAPKALDAFQRALEDNQAVLDGHPQHPPNLNPYIADAHFNMARAYAGLGKTAQARQSCDRAVALDPQRSEWRKRQFEEWTSY